MIGPYWFQVAYTFVAWVVVAVGVFVLFGGGRR